MEFFQKLIDTGRVGSRYYLMFHLIPFLLRVRKVQNLKDLVVLMAKTATEYAKSLLFISFLVGTLRGGICLNCNQPQ